MRETGTLELKNSQRREFVRSFADQAWVRPGAERPVTRVHVALMVTMGCLVLALVTGVVLQLLRPVRFDEPVVTEPTSAAPSYSSVSGWDSASAPDRGFDAAGR